MRIAGFIAALAILVTFPPQIEAFTHIGRTGETLPQLAERYYGRSELEIVIRAANGFVHPDDGSLTQGERIEIPELGYHRVQPGETWGSLADQYLGTSKRARYLAELNDHSPTDALSEGAIVKVPYHARHIFAGKESLKSVAKLYYGKKHSPNWLRKYNLTFIRKFGRGDVLIIPLIDLELKPEEQKKLDEKRSRLYSDSDAQNQQRALDGIASMKNTFDQGKFIETVTIGARLLGLINLTIPQQIGIHKYLAYAYVALGTRDLALDSFRTALELQPGMELSPITTSPKILSVFREARSDLGQTAGKAHKEQKSRQRAPKTIRQKNRSEKNHPG